MTRPPTRVLLVDDQPLFRGALASVIAAQPDFEVVAQASNGHDGIDEALKHRPDVAVLDVDMPVLDGISAAVVILERLPDTRVTMLSVSDSPTGVLRALRGGVQGYLLKDASPDDFVAALRRIAAGGVAIAPDLLSVLVSELRATSPSAPLDADDTDLSTRELEIMSLVADGLTNREIGQRLFITEGTVKNHVHHALQKLQVTTRGQAAAILRERHLKH